MGLPVDNRPSIVTRIMRSAFTATVLVLTVVGSAAGAVVWLHSAFAPKLETAQNIRRIEVEVAGYIKRQTDISIKRQKNEQITQELRSLENQLNTYQTLGYCDTAKGASLCLHLENRIKRLRRQRP